MAGPSGPRNELRYNNCIVHCWLMEIDLEEEKSFTVVEDIQPFRCSNGPLYIARTFNTPGCM